MIPTIKDVAAHAGFSIATVSRAINAPHTVNPVTLDKVRQSIDALNFRPSPLGRQLRGERTVRVEFQIVTRAHRVLVQRIVDEEILGVVHRQRPEPIDRHVARHRQR